MKTSILWLAVVLGVVSTIGFAADVNLRVVDAVKEGSNPSLQAPTILVHGKNNKYDQILNDRLVFNLLARVTIGKNFNKKVAVFRPGSLLSSVQGADSKTLNTIALEPWFGTHQSTFMDPRGRPDFRIIELEFHYQDPVWDHEKRTARAPILLCNDLLKSKTGAARKKFLDDGGALHLSKAYSWASTYQFMARPRGRLYVEPWTVTETGTSNAIVRCIGLNRPVARKTVVTAGPHEIGKGRKGKSPSEYRPFSTLKLDIEPMKVTVDLPGDMRCPASLRLHATMTAKREFVGRAILLGLKYQSPPTALNYPHGGTRNLVVTYPIQWSNKSELSDRAIAVSKITGKPLSKDLKFALRVFGSDDEIVATTEFKELSVTCEKIPQIKIGSAQVATNILAPNAPSEDDSSSNTDQAISDFDVSIRNAERLAADRLKISIYNAGPQSAEYCRWTMTTEQAGDSSAAGESLEPIASGQTIDIEHLLDAPLTDYSAAAIQVDCDGESVSRSANNLHVLIK